MSWDNDIMSIKAPNVMILVPINLRKIVFFVTIIFNKLFNREMLWFKYKLIQFVK